LRDENNDFDEPYLPERYREIVRKKKQRRQMRKIGMIAIAIAAVVIAIILVTGFFSGNPQPAAASGPAPAAATVSPAPSAVAPTVTAVTPQATTGLPATVPVAATSTTAAAVTQPAIAVTATPEPIQTASANTYVTPDTSTPPRITENQAKAIALASFPGLPTGDLAVELTAAPDFGNVWKYTLRADTTVEASGLIDADSGTVLTFNRTIQAGGRPQNPVLTMASARQIADTTINDRNNAILSINMTDSSYVPLATPSGSVAGTYRFVYNRVIQDYPCDVDGFVVSVDAVTGVVTEYVQHWQSPDNAFNVLEDPLVTKYDAIYTVQAMAKSIYPASIQGVRIISADRRWKDQHDPAITPRPSSIPLAWKVVFDDDIIRAKAGAPPAVGWVDAHSGDLIGITYQH